MKNLKHSSALVFVLMLFIVFSFYRGQVIKTSDANIQDTVIAFPDGKYSGQSRFTYTDEPYWGSVQITVNKGLFTEISFVIRDSNLHETFNGDYEKHFQGNELYIQQCRNDWNGVKTYPPKMIETQDVNKIDAISGATWSYNIFKESVKEALKRTKKQPE